MVRVADVRRGADDAGQRHAVTLHDVGVGDLLDRELHVGKLALPARLEPRHRLEHQVVELLGAGAVQRDARRGQRAAQPAPVPVTPPRPGTGTRAGSRARIRPGTGAWPGAAVTGLHSHREYLI